MPTLWAAFTTANHSGIVNKILLIWSWSNRSHSSNNGCSNSFSVLGRESYFFTVYFNICHTFSMGFKSGEQDGWVPGPKPSTRSQGYPLQFRPSQTHKVVPHNVALRSVSLRRVAGSLSADSASATSPFVGSPSAVSFQSRRVALRKVALCNVAGSSSVRSSSVTSTCKYCLPNRHGILISHAMQLPWQR
jgi:hypothetical protein